MLYELVIFSKTPSTVDQDEKRNYFEDEGFILKTGAT